MVRLTSLERLMFDIANRMDDGDSRKVRYEAGLTAAERDRANSPARLLVMTKRKCRTFPEFVQRLRDALLSTSNAELYREILDKYDNDESGEGQPSFHSQPSTVGATVSGPLPSRTQKHQFRKVLSRVAEMLSKTKLNMIVAIVDLLETQKKEISNVLDLFDILERSGKIAFNDVEFLEEILFILKEMDAVQLLTDYRSNLQISVGSITPQSISTPSSLPRSMSSGLHPFSISMGPAAVSPFLHNHIFPTDESLAFVRSLKRSDTTPGFSATLDQTSPKRPRMESEENLTVPSAPPPPPPPGESSMPSQQDPVVQLVSPSQPSPVLKSPNASVRPLNSLVAGACSSVEQPEVHHAARPPPYNPFQSSTAAEETVKVVGNDYSLPGFPTPRRSQRNVIQSAEMAKLSQFKSSFVGEHQEEEPASSFEQQRTPSNTGEIYMEPHLQVRQEAVHEPCVPPLLPVLYSNCVPPSSVNPQFAAPPPAHLSSTATEERVKVVGNNYSLPGYPTPRGSQRNVIQSAEMARVSQFKSSFVGEEEPATAVAASPTSRPPGEDSRHQNSLNRSSPPTQPQAVDEIRDEESNTSNADDESSHQNPSNLSPEGEGSKEQEEINESGASTRRGWFSWWPGRK